MVDPKREEPPKPDQFKDEKELSGDSDSFAEALAEKAESAAVHGKARTVVHSAYRGRK